ncbi:MAG: metal-sensitive transcriptional regulator [Dehalococcoidia bacterium]|nr:metal-sensitive transcriptional regulator [Dehalococcoidia bacterium]MDP6782031.1 metal-sensitive transcriptional regulator [Dehalococcoidia bacterium]
MARVATAPRRYKYSQDKDALLARLKRIEGQARGVQRMLEGDRYCVDVVQQLNAISAAVDEVALIVLQNHIEGCVSEAIREGAGEERIQELMDVLRRAVRR